MPRIKRMITLTAIAAATATAAPAIAAAASSAGSGSGSSSTPTHADLVAAELAATHTSAPLYQFGLIHIHAIPPITATTTSDPDRFQPGDAAIDQHTTQSVPGGPPILPRVRASEQAAINRAQAAEAQALAYSPSPTARYSSAEFNAYASAVHPVVATPPTIKAPNSGFDWGDAGIGAAGGFGLSMLALGLVLVLSQHRARRSNSPAATAR
ncbi:MAG: hypothetical protein JO363_21300 [Solirubrobacterales bacterium]|nr:hypothetical protein [Solirubrobacterales bacterium]